VLIELQRCMVMPNGKAEWQTSKQLQLLSVYFFRLNLFPLLEFNSQF
jgi:hypothetical protein